MSTTCTGKDNLIKILTSNPSLNDIVDILLEGIDQNDQVVVKGDEQFIFVDSETVDGVTTYTVRYEPYIPLSINSFGDNIGLQLKGTTVTTFTLSWNYNKSVQIQSLNQGLTAPTPIEGTTSYSITPTGLSITSDTNIRLTADDIALDNNNARIANNSILFGNYIYQTQIVIADRDDITTSTINGLDLPNLNKTLTRSRSLTFTGASTSTSYDVILMPTSFGLTSGGQFKDLATNFTGGWGKLFDINLTNEAGFTEEYGVWVASNKNLSGLTFQIN